MLSHRKLAVDVMRADLTGLVEARDLPPLAGYDGVKVVTEEELDDLGMATLAKKVLAAAGIPSFPR